MLVCVWLFGFAVSSAAAAAPPPLLAGSSPPARLPSVCNSASPGSRAPAPQAQQLCGLPMGMRFFPLTLSIGNLTECNREPPGTVFSSNWTALMTPQPPTWTDNVNAAR